MKLSFALTLLYSYILREAAQESKALLCDLSLTCAPVSHTDIAGASLGCKEGSREGLILTTSQVIGTLQTKDSAEQSVIE